jgi:Protein of unknown function (Hypoth_ymh)
LEIADVAGALEKVRQFIALLEKNERIRNAVDSTVDKPQLKQSDGQIQEHSTLILQIAERVDAALARELSAETEFAWQRQAAGGGWCLLGAMEACQKLAGLLSTAGEAEQILGTVGPNLPAAGLHPWIWNAAVSLWGDGHIREAVQAAAAALFDHHLPTKLGVPPARSARDLVAQAFSAQAPTAGSSRLRLDDYPVPSPSWTSQHEGAQFFGMGCAQLIRNLVTHGAQPDEQTALEQLASLSLLAGLIERARVETL